MTPTQIEKAAQEYASTIEPDRLGCGDLESAFEAGAEWYMSKIWIPVDERLPESDGFVMVFVLANPTFGMPDRYEIAYYDGEDWYTQDGEHVRPTHWCDIPQLNPEKEER